MERVWSNAPFPAVRVWSAAGQVQRVEANEAARRWAAALGLDDRCWPDLAGAAHDSRVEIGGAPVRVHRIALDDGALLWLQPDAGDGVSMDIHQRLRVLDEMSRPVAGAVGIGFWSRNLDTGAVHWDEQLFRQHGRPPELGPPAREQWIAEMVHPHDHAYVTEQHRRGDAEWLPLTEACYRLRDGGSGERWMRSWTRRVRRDGQRLVFGMQMDVTDSVLAQARLERAQMRLQFAVEAAQVGVWERAVDGRIVYWSPAMYRLRGLDPDDPRSPAEIAAQITHPEDAARWHRLVEQHLRDGRPYRHEIRVRWPDGEWHWLDSQGFALRDADGQVTAMAGLNTDLTERRQAESLRLEMERAEQASRDKSAFMARMSHELRTPMNAVLGFARLMRDDAAEPLTPHQHGRLGRIVDAGAQMMTLVNDLLDLSGLQADTEGPMPVLALDEVVAGTAQALAPLAARHGVRLQCHVVPADAAPAQVRSPRGRLSQALGHLVRQALRTLTPGATLRLSLRPRGDGAVTDWAVVVAAEVAAGVPAASAAAPGDDDIGYSLAQHIAQALGGEVEHGEPAPGGAAGREFRLWLPAARPPEAPAPARPPADPPAPAAEASAAPLSVLCVEDNPVNLLLVRELMALRPAIRLLTAEDGLSGLAVALAERPDLLLLDLQLPDISGLELLKRLRAEPTLAGSVCIALSADAMPTHIGAARAAGFDDYWTKPIDFERFLGGIDAIAARKAAGR